MSESITIFSDNSWYTNIARNRKILIHGIVFGLATGLAILSTWFEYHRKATRKGHGHFDSFHGVFGKLIFTYCFNYVTYCYIFQRCLQQYVLYLPALVDWQ